MLCNSSMQTCFVNPEVHYYELTQTTDSDLEKRSQFFYANTFCESEVLA